MIMTLVFIVSLLIGISLFVAVVGTAFLKKHARRLKRPAVYYPGMRNAGRRDSGFRDTAGRNRMPGRAYYRDTVPHDTALEPEIPGEEGPRYEGYRDRGPSGYPEDSYGYGDYRPPYEDYRSQERRATPPGVVDGGSYRTYKEHFRNEFQEKVGGGFDRPVEMPGARPPREGNQYQPAKPFDYGATGRPAVQRSSGSWFFIIIVAIIFVIFSAFFGIKGYRNFVSKPTLAFCESVDYIKQRPVNRSNTFTRGNVTIFVKSREPLGQHTARVDIYRIDQTGLEPFAGKELSIKPEWTSYSFKVLFDELGVYSVMVFDAEGVLLKQKRLYIVHDSYAYKPVSR
jgi:hypothetical protein